MKHDIQFYDDKCHMSFNQFFNICFEHNSDISFYHHCTCCLHNYVSHSSFSWRYDIWGLVCDVTNKHEHTCLKRKTLKGDFVQNNFFSNTHLFWFRFGIPILLPGTCKNWKLKINVRGTTTQNIKNKCLNKTSRKIWISMCLWKK